MSSWDSTILKALYHNGFQGQNSGPLPPGVFSGPFFSWFLIFAYWRGVPEQWSEPLELDRKLLRQVAEPPPRVGDERTATKNPYTGVQEPGDRTISHPLQQAGPGFRKSESRIKHAVQPGKNAPCARLATHLANLAIGNRPGEPWLMTARNGSSQPRGSVKRCHLTMASRKPGKQGAGRARQSPPTTRR